MRRPTLPKVFCRFPVLIHSFHFLFLFSINKQTILNELKTIQVYPRIPLYIDWGDSGGGTCQLWDVQVVFLSNASGLLGFLWVCFIGSRFLETLSQVLDSYLPRMSGFQLLKAVYHLCLLGHFPPAPLQQLLQSSTIEQLETTGQTGLPSPELSCSLAHISLLNVLVFCFLGVFFCLFSFQIPSISSHMRECSKPWSCVSVWTVHRSLCRWPSPRRFWESPPRTLRRPNRGSRRAFGVRWRARRAPPCRKWC